MMTIDIQIVFEPLECSMFDIADNALEIPFVNVHTPEMLSISKGAVADDMLVSCYSQARPTFARERMGLVKCIYNLPHRMVWSDHVTVSCHMTHLYINV